MSLVQKENPTSLFHINSTTLVMTFKPKNQSWWEIRSVKRSVPGSILHWRIRTMTTKGERSGWPVFKPKSTDIWPYNDQVKWGWEIKKTLRFIITLKQKNLRNNVYMLKTFRKITPCGNRETRFHDGSEPSTRAWGFRTTHEKESELFHETQQQNGNLCGLRGFLTEWKEGKK